MSPRRRSGEHAADAVRRLPVVVLLVAGLVAATVAGDPEPRRPPEAPSTRNAVALPAEGTRSSAWYCPGAPPSKASPARSALTVSNTGPTDSTAVVTVMADGERVASRHVDLPARTVVRVGSAEFSDVANPAVVVETFGADVVVEHAVSTGGDLAAGPCATQPAAQWYFANGTTVRGVEQWLVLFNPFGDDAIVDLSFYTDEGRKEIDSLRGLDVPRHSQIAVPIHERVLRQAFVAVAVSARVGRVVAEQSELFLPDSGRSGITASMGSPSSALEWSFPFGYRRPGETLTIGISNPGDLETEADVQVVADGETFIEPVTVTIPRRSAVLVNLGECPEKAPSCVNVPADLAYQVIVTSATDVPVVAEELAVYTDSDVLVGALSTLGVSSPSTRWIFGRTRYPGERRSNLVVSNPGAEPVDVRVELVTDGKVRVPNALRGLRIEAGRRAVIDLAEIQPDRESDAAVVVEASAPVVAEQAVVRSEGISAHMGIPERG